MTYYSAYFKFNYFLVYFQYFDENPCNRMRCDTRQKIERNITYMIER